MSILGDKHLCINFSVKELFFEVYGIKSRKLRRHRKTLELNIELKLYANKFISSANWIIASLSQDRDRVYVRIKNSLFSIIAKCGHYKVKQLKTQKALSPQGGHVVR